MGRKQKYPERGMDRVCERCGTPFTEKSTVGPGRFCSRDCYWQTLRAEPDRAPLAERFWAFVQRSPDCWEWTGALRDTGYGQIWVRAEKRQIKAHRVSWQMHYGPIPEGMFVCHRCDNRKCVRPDHLFLSDNRGNMQDCAGKDRISYGEHRPQSKLNPLRVMAARGAHAQGVSYSGIAAFYGVAPGTIKDAVLRVTWRRVP